MASQRTRLEGTEIVGKVGDDHFHNFMWETAGWFVRVARLWRAVPEEAIELGFALTPNGHHVSRKVSPCDTNRSQNGSHALVGGLLLNIEDTGSLEGFIFSVGGSIVAIAIVAGMGYWLGRDRVCNWLESPGPIG